MGSSRYSHVRLFLPLKKNLRMREALAFGKEYENMNQKDWKRSYAGEVMTVLGMLVLLALICRLWPLLLLFLLGIFAVALRLLFLGLNQKEPLEPLPFLPEPVKEPTERDVSEMAYAVILR